MKNQHTTRIIYADFLRVFSLLAVCVIHACASFISGVPTGTLRWEALNYAISLSRFCVPVFFMLSGMFFLDGKREITIKEMYTKRLLRIVTAFLFWSALYAAVQVFVLDGKRDFASFSDQLIKGHFHLWFLYAIAGLYVLTPILRSFIRGAGRREIEYFLLITFIVSSVKPLIDRLDWKAAKMLVLVINNLSLYHVIGYTGYFVLGYYLSHYDFPRAVKRLIWISGVLGGISTALFTSLLSQKAGGFDAVLYEYRTPGVFFMSCALFLTAKELDGKIHVSDKVSAIITKLSSLTFGAYLVHEFFNIFFTRIGFTSVSFNSFFAIPAVSVCVFVLSMLVSFVISKIRFLNRYIA